MENLLSQKEMNRLVSLNYKCGWGFNNRQLCIDNREAHLFSLHIQQSHACNDGRGFFQ